MPNRIDKVNSLLEHQLSALLHRDVFFPDGALVTLTHVDCSSNLIEAKAYVSVFPEDKSQEVLRILQKELYDIQQKINRSLKMRPIPKIKFVQDKTFSNAGKVEEILAQLKKEEK